MNESMPLERRAQFLANIRNEAGRIQDIVDRMLELSELESKRTLPKTETISFNALIRTVLESKEPMLSQKGLSVKTQMADGISVKGDPFLLHQAVSNLVQNAIDFSPAQGQITLTALADGGMLNFTVDDQGPGVPDYAREKVFDKFFSLPRPATGKKSTGLGLNLVKEVVVLHHGEIRLDNLPEKGLRAALRIPV
jgi:two-component system sensor histidine kinase CreC